MHVSVLFDGDCVDYRRHSVVDRFEAEVEGAAADALDEHRVESVGRSHAAQTSAP